MRPLVEQRRTGTSGGDPWVQTGGLKRAAKMVGDLRDRSPLRAKVGHGSMRSNSDSSVRTWWSRQREKPNKKLTPSALQWNYIQPQDPVTAFLVEDFVNIGWRLQRPRRCETAEIRRRTETARYRRHFEKISEVDSLKGRFMRDYVRLCSPALEKPDREALSLSLGETRKQLAQTSLGLEFLIGRIQPIARTVESCGFFSASAALTLIAACGEEDEEARSCVTLNQIFKVEMEKSKKAKAADKTTFEQNKLVLSELLKSKMHDMRVKKDIFRKLESTEEETYLASLVMPPTECSEKIHRAEAALERRLFRTLNYLLALQDVKLPR